MLGMNPETMLRMALQMIDFSDPASVAKIRDALANLELDPKERAKCIQLLQLAGEALAEKVAA